MEELFLSYLAEVWGERIANLYENGNITIEQLKDLNNGYWITATTGERFNGLENYK